MIPSTSARRFLRLMASAASSMNCCGLRLKSSSRPLSIKNPHETASSQLSLVLKIGKKIRQLDVRFFDNDRRGHVGFFG